ncbi:hypothetical protein N894_0842 [Francisella tularensis subsp. novicida PA10-7858]|nr:hypothetical protein N894_0842 [Francisella tularensis subsp. novicida PA10-7858]
MITLLLLAVAFIATLYALYYFILAIFKLIVAIYHFNYFFSKTDSKN